MLQETRWSSTHSEALYFLPLKNLIPGITQSGMSSSNSATESK